VIEHRVTHLNGCWQIQASRHIHTARYPDLEHALAYLACRLPVHTTAVVVVTDARGVTGLRLVSRDEIDCTASSTHLEGIADAPQRLPDCGLRRCLR
jgi:hypothetical protein